MDIQFYWVKYRIQQGHYNLFLKLGAKKLADYINKHYQPHHHRYLLPVYLHCTGNANNASTRVCYYSNNTILKEIPKQGSNKEAH